MSQEPPRDLAAQVLMCAGLQIPLRDGVTLNATVYLPKAHPEPAPCIFTLTPYISDTFHDRGLYFAAHGWPFAIIDVRGRGNSQGVFSPNLQEARDGFDVVNWLASQPYCNGKVGMWGGSYAGYSQWAVAKEFPKQLATIVPVAAPYLGVDFPMRNNIFSPYGMQWLAFTSGRTSQAILFQDSAFWNERFRAHFEKGAPLKTFDEAVGYPSAIFQEWLEHPHPDEFWDRYNPSSEQYARLELPILTITGIYDDDQPGALMHYREHMRLGTTTATNQHYLVIGPWDHAGTRTPQIRVGGLEFGPESLVDLGQLHLQWYHWTLLGGSRPEFLRDRVAYYVTGAEKWRYANTLEGVTVRKDPYYLHSRTNPTGVFQSGTLAMRPPSDSPSAHYTYDPMDVRTAELQSRMDPFSLVDQRLILASSGGHWIFHSDVFEAQSEISGFFELTAWLAIDQPDTDFEVSVHEVLPDGSSVLLTTDRLRARYRENLREPKLVRTRAPIRYDFTHFTFVARQISKGSRLRLMLGPLNSIFNEKNSNCGGAVAHESMQAGRPVNVFLHHDSAHPSVLHVPIGSTPP